MKYLVILADGMADEPQAQLQGLTPLQAASTPNLDKLAQTAYIGQVKTIPAAYPPGSDVANLSVLGYDPAEYYTGRSPLEAVSMGVELGANDLALRCNLVTLSEAARYADQTMIDYSSGEISTEESHELMKFIAQELEGGPFRFYPGISYRHLLVWQNGRGSDLQLTPPHDISGQPITDYLPGGEQGVLLLELMMKSQKVLRNHPVNQQRLKEGHPPATSIWLWGEGVRPSMPTFQELYGLSGSVVAAVDLVKGLGICAGLKPVTVPGATGAVVTNFAGKIEAALQCLNQGDDFVYVHIESPDEAGHQGNLDTKIWSIEQVDQLVIGPLLENLAGFEEIRVLVMPDHPTPVRIRTHSSDPVPYLLFDSKQPNPAGPSKYDEVSARQGLFINEGHQLMKYFIKG